MLMTKVRSQALFPHKITSLDAITFVCTKCKNTPMKALHIPAIDTIRRKKFSDRKKLLDSFQDLIELKTERNNLIEVESKLHFFIALSISLFLIILTFEHQFKTTSVTLDVSDDANTIETLAEIPKTTQPPPPPPPKVIPQRIVEVADTRVVDEIQVEMDVEMHEETIVEEIIYVMPEPEEEEKVEEIFQIVEKYPEPVGGYPAFYSYLSDHLKYPVSALRVGVSGRVFVQFVVEKDGSLSNILVVKGIGFGCDEEAVRVLKNAPPWQPGKQRGRAVRVRQSLPIFFEITN